MRMPTAIPAAAMLKTGAPNGWMRVGLMTVRAKKPSTTLGIEASTSSTGLSQRRMRRLAYSDR